MGLSLGEAGRHTTVMDYNHCQWRSGGGGGWLMGGRVKAGILELKAGTTHLTEGWHTAVGT